MTALTLEMTIPEKAFVPPVWHSKKSDEHPTPQKVFDELDREFGFTLDPCATAENAKCKKFYTQAENGLLQSWGGEVVFMNPPYSDVAKWMRKAYHAALEESAMVDSLVPSRTDTAWFHDYAIKAEIRFIRGRLRFGNATENAPFPSMIVVFRPGSVGDSFGGLFKGVTTK